HAIRRRLDARDRLPIRVGERRFDGAAILAEMRRDGRSVQHVLQRRGEDVLAGVLLHLVEAALPVDLGLHLASLARAIQPLPRPPPPTPRHSHPRASPPPGASSPLAAPGARRSGSPPPLSG